MRKGLIVPVALVPVLVVPVAVRQRRPIETRTPNGAARTTATVRHRRMVARRFCTIAHEDVMLRRRRR